MGKVYKDHQARIVTLENNATELGTRLTNIASGMNKTINARVIASVNHQVQNVVPDMVSTQAQHAINNTLETQIKDRLDHMID